MIHVEVPRDGVTPASFVANKSFQWQAIDSNVVSSNGRINYVAARLATKGSYLLLYFQSRNRNEMRYA